MKKPEFGFGTHLTIDGYGCTQCVAKDEYLIKKFLDEFPEKIGMTKILGPIVTFYDAPNMMDSGVTGVVIIAESHISVHTFPWKSFVSVDVFSCCPFDTGAATRLIMAYFGMKKIECRVFDRGQEFPNDETTALKIIEQQRRFMK